MSLKEYARPPQKRKAYVQQPGLLLVGVDVRQANHHACIGTQTASPAENSYLPIAVRASSALNRPSGNTGQKQLPASTDRHGAVWYLLAGTL